MRSYLASLLVLLSALAAQAPAFQAYAQSCTGLCLQQMSCPNGATTSISGVVYAPNNVDPLPNVLVYIPNSAVSAFTPGVSCAVGGQPPSGSPLVGTTTAVDGTFTLTNVPVGTNIPLVVQSGRWRRQVVVSATTACSNTAFSTRFPQNQNEGDLPHIAVVTGEADGVECVLRKVGVADTEFTDASGSGRVNLFTATGSPGAIVDANTPTGDVLLGSPATLSAYDVLMLPCEGSAFTKQAPQLANLVSYADAGGRVYASHFSYDWLYENAPFNTVVQWAVDQAQLPDGIATVDTGFVQGQTLSQWLGDVGAAAAPGEVAISTLRHDLNGVNAPTQTWLTLNDPAAGNPVMQFTFNTPVNTPAQACGRVLFNEYHVENTTNTLGGQPFPAECNNAPMTPQEKLLEFSLFDLTGSGNPPSLSPLNGNFGTEPIGFASATEKFLWTNNTIFPVTVTGVNTSGDFALASNACENVGVGASCEIDVTFSPTAIGARTGALNVVASTGTLSAALTGNGVSPLSISSTSLSFGKIDVGALATQTLILANQTAVPVPFPAPTASGDFTANSSCGASIPAHSNCVITVSFTPTTTGTRSGTLNIGAGVTAASGPAGTYTPANTASLTGVGVDFALAVGPASAQTVAGIAITTTSTTSPIAGFGNPVTVSCATAAPGSTCTLATDGFTPASATGDSVTVNTTSQYTVVGYSGLGGTAGSRRGTLLTLLAAFTGVLLLGKRRAAHRLAAMARLTALLLCLASMASLLGGCTGKDPAQNSPYTPAGTYTYTVTATDGFLKHSATYTLVVTSR